MQEGRGDGEEEGEEKEEEEEEEEEEEQEQEQEEEEQQQRHPINITAVSQLARRDEPRDPRARAGAPSRKPES